MLLPTNLQGPAGKDTHKHHCGQRIANPQTRFRIRVLQGQLGGSVLGKHMTAIPVFPQGDGKTKGLSSTIEPPFPIRSLKQVTAVVLIH